MIKHKHADLIIAWANGAEIQWSDVGVDWYDCGIKPEWNEFTEYRVKPIPVRIYPKTTLTPKELDDLYFDTRHLHTECLERVANEAIKRYIIETEGAKQ